VSKAPSSTSSGPGRFHGGIPPLPAVIATNLANAHTTDQYLTVLAALAFALAHDTLILRR
jgi:hypothetical protein